VLKEAQKNFTSALKYEMSSVGLGVLSDSRATMLSINMSVISSCEIFMVFKHFLAEF
jgi:hypothetical protein